MNKANEPREFWVFPEPTKLTGFPGEHIAITQPSTPENLIHVREIPQEEKSEPQEVKGHRKYYDVHNDFWREIHRFKAGEINEVQMDCIARARFQECYQIGKAQPSKESVNTEMLEALKSHLSSMQTWRKEFSGNDEHQTTVVNTLIHDLKKVVAKAVCHL
jgi:hypothetical protein